VTATASHCRGRDGARRGRVFWSIVALGLLTGSAWQYALAARARPSAVELVACQLLAGALYLLAVVAVLRSPRGPSWRAVLFVGLVARLILLPTTPLFDDDIYRYLWEGKVLAHGLNPFLYPPLAEELVFLRDANWTRVGYPQISTIYPPLAQYLFALCYLLGARSVVALKAVFVLFDLGNMLLLGRLLGLLKRPRRWALIYAWSPLAMKEFANSGHLEPVMLFLLLGAVWLWLRSPRASWWGLSFGAALSVKPVPLLLAPLFWRVGGGRPLAWGLALFAALYLPFAGAGRLLLSGTAAYARYWTFNPSAFALFAWLQSALHTGLPLARAAAALLVGGYALYAARRADPADPSRVMRTMRNVLAVCLLLSPAADPWYVCWLLPFLCFAPSPGLLLLSVTCNLSYLYYAHRTFPAWIPLLEYLPVYGLLAVELFAARGRGALAVPEAGRAALTVGQE
jgi:alpha-1,6-mannosyltransferase